MFRLGRVAGDVSSLRAHWKNWQAHLLDFPNRDGYSRGLRDSMSISTKDRKKGVLESVRVPKGKLGWSCFATGKRKKMVNLTHITLP